MKKLLVICLFVIAAANTAYASNATCDSISSQVENTKSTLIAAASNPIVSDIVLGSTRESLNGLMDNLNTAGLPEDICPVSNLSAEIAQILQAVSDLERRNTLTLAKSAL